MNTSKMQPLYSWCARVCHRCADSRLDAQKRKSLREVLVEGLWRKITILIPPDGGPVNLRLLAS